MDTSITKLDDPFTRNVTLAPPAVATPTGDELVMGTECSDVTVVMDSAKLMALLQQSNPHRHSTVREIPAVR